MTPDLARQLELPDAEGVAVTSVEAGSPAEAAGISTGDVIEKVGKTKVTSVEEFRKALDDVSLSDGVVMLVRNAAGARFLVIQVEK